MENTALLKPTLHVEVLLLSHVVPSVAKEVCDEVAQILLQQYASLAVGEEVKGYAHAKHAALVDSVFIVDYTGPDRIAAYHKLAEVQLDVQSYHLRAEFESESNGRRRIGQQADQDTEVPQARILCLPNVALKDEWDSLIYDDALPSQLLRYLSRMLGVMKQPGLNLSTFNWNRLCLLHGPPGSGKSTLCRALAQKLSIRLSRSFPNALLVEVNTNSMLSKYFGESGKLITTLFERIHTLAQSSTTLVCVVMDEVETIAGSREKVTAGGECNDGLRATNQLLTALDRIRALPNIIVMCTSNLLHAIDPAFLDRVDIKQLIPSPSAAAIYNIFRSCLNELVRSSLIDVATERISSTSSAALPSASPSNRSTSNSSEQQSSSPGKAASSSQAAWNYLTVPSIPSLPHVKIRQYNQPDSPGTRVWAVSQKCEGFSGRTLRRLPILGLAMYTWGGNCSLYDAVTALECAVDQELMAKQTGKDG